MGTLSEQLKQYLATATPEQLEEDKKLMEQWKNVGPSVDEYLRGVNDTMVEKLKVYSFLDEIAQAIVNYILSGQYEHAQTFAMEYNEIKENIRKCYGII